MAYNQLDMRRRGSSNIGTTPGGRLEGEVVGALTSSTASGYWNIGSLPASAFNLSNACCRTSTRKRRKNGQQKKQGCDLRTSATSQYHTPPDHLTVARQGIPQLLSKVFQSQCLPLVVLL